MDDVQNFISEAQKVVNPENAPIPMDAPKVPFQSALKLTGEQEKRMLEHAFKRFHELSNDIGRDQTMQPQWWMNQTAAANSSFLASQGLQPSETFLGKRSRYDATFLNDFSWRPYTMGPDNIFLSSNIPVPLVRRICRQMIAKAINGFFGTDPWFSIDPAPVPEYDPQNDAERADRIEKFCRFKLKESNSKDDKERAIKRALVLGECAVKTTYVVRDQMFNVEARVLHGIDGNPVRGADGNFFTEDDMGSVRDAEDGTGRKVFARDGLTEAPLAPVFQEIPLNRRQVLFEGARSEVIYFKDILIPLTAPDVQQADTVVHCYDKPVMEFVDLVVKRGMVGDDADSRLGAAQKMVALVKQLSNNDPKPKSAANQQLRPNDNFQAPPSVETGGPIAEFCEFYLWFDANGDGVAENIMLIADKNTQAPIFYDHVANVTTDGLRPIEIVRINPVEGRWYGLGIFELFESYQTIVDLLVNRWNFSCSNSGYITFWTPTKTQEGDRDPNLKINNGGTYTCKPNEDPEKVLHRVYLTDTKFSDVKEMIEFFLQLCLNESGVSTANDGKMAGLASDELATGIMENVKSGDELFRPIMADLKGPLERLLNREIDVTLANLNPEEVYSYLEGNDMGIAKLTPDDVRGLKFKTTITLTTVRNQEKLQMCTAVVGLVNQFYSQTPFVQMRTAQFFKIQIRTLDPSCDVDTLIVPLSPLEVMPGGAEGGGAPEQQGGGTPFEAQLKQKNNQQPGVSAPGGTMAG